MTVLEIPDGNGVIDDLPHKLSDELLIDEALDGDPSFLLVAIGLANEGNDRGAAEILRFIRRRAGESNYAIEQWIEMKEWVEGE
jgi:hypothetical protein